jgi:hypothetical protein
VHKGINWLYSHPVNIGENKDFKVGGRYTMIGYNDKNVYVVTIKPQLNDLNYNEFLTDSIVDTYLVMNTGKVENDTDIESNNYTKFKGKEVLSCVLSTNKDDIFIVNWTSAIKDKTEYIRKLLYDMMNTRFGNMHLQYYNTFKNIVDLHLDKPPESIVEMCNSKLTDDIPIYLKKFFNKIEGDIDECNSLEEKKEIIDKYCKKDKFMKLMDNMLNKSIKTFLGIHE